MAQSYAEVTKKNIHNEDDVAENLHADIHNQTHQNRHNGIHHEFDANENLEANLTRKGDIDVGSSSNLTGKPENQHQKSHNKGQTSRGTGKGGNRKASRGKVALGVAVDIVIAGLLVGWIVRKPSINKTHVGLGTIGLGLLYGVQWTVYKKLTSD